MEKGLSKLVVSISRPFSVRNQPVHLCSVCKDVFQEQRTLQTFAVCYFSVCR